MPRGRPPAITKAKETRIAELIWLAYTDQQIAALVDVHQKTIQRARNGDLCPRIKKLALELEEPFRRKLWEDQYLPAGVCWMLERRYPSQFAKPEVQLTFQHNSFTQNNLQINITRAEMKEIEAQASPVRESVKKMFANYKPVQLGNGNGNNKSPGEQS